MSDFAAVSLNPGADSPAEEFDPGERAGMRAAGWILLANAVVTVAMLVVTLTAAGMVSAIVDVIIGTRLLKLRHSWRAWAMLRAAVGMVLGLLAIFGMPAIQEPLRVGVFLGAIGQWLYGGAILMLLAGRPAPPRVRLGLGGFALAVLFVAAGVTMQFRGVGELRRMAGDIGAFTPADGPVVRALPGTQSLELLNLPEPDVEALRQANLSTAQWQQLWRIDGPNGETGLAGTYAIVPGGVAFVAEQPLLTGLTYTSYIFPPQLPRPSAGDDLPWRSEATLIIAIQAP